MRLTNHVAPLALMVAAFLPAFRVAADDESFDLEGDPYVTLYRERAEIRDNNIASTLAVANYAEARYERARRLYQQNHMSLEEYQELQTEHLVATIRHRDSQLRANEAKSMLKIARLRVQAGQAMPICPVGTYGDAGE